MAKLTDTEVERVAKAMHAAMRKYWQRHSLDLLSWAETDEWRRREIRVAARAAIKALQKPRRRQGE